MLDINKYNFFVFDLDGTLIDSHGFYDIMDSVYVQHLYNKTVSVKFLADLEMLFRKRLNTAYSMDYYMLLDKYYGKGNLNENQILQKLRFVKENFILPKIKFKKWAVDTLTELKNIYNVKKFALVTGSNKQEIDFFSNDSRSDLKNSLNINSFFDVIITRDDVTNLKPNPESYNLVLKKLHIQNSAEMLVFEDSLDGILAAKASKACVIGIRNDYMLRDRFKIQALSDYYYNDWYSVLKTIRYKHATR